MITEVPIPKLGQSEETVVIESWKVKEGDTVKKGDILFELETDKSVLEVESQFEGTVLKILVPAGKEVPVMTTGLVLGEPGDKVPDIKIPSPEKKTDKKASKPKKTNKKTKTEKKPPLKKEKPPSPVPEKQLASEPVTKPKPSPRARKFAEKLMIDLNKVSGTGGESGRVTEQDVKDYLEESGYYNIKITPAAENLAEKENLELLEIEGTGDTGRITLKDVRNAVKEKPREFSSMRRIIAERLSKSKQTAPHFYLSRDIDLTEVQKYRRKLKEEGIKLSVNVFIIKAVAETLKKFPMLNASTDGQTVSYKAKINIGVAVSIDSGLVVPVIKNADSKALDEIQAESAEFAEKARSGKLNKDDMSGGTFTISNMGMLGVDDFAAIINPGETAILAVSAGLDKPVVKDGEITIRNIMRVTVSADHRAVDGADSAKFATELKAKLEDMEYWKSQI